MRRRHDRSAQSPAPERSVLWARLVLFGLLVLCVAGGLWLRGLDLGLGQLAQSADGDAEVAGTPVLRELASQSAPRAASAAAQRELTLESPDESRSAESPSAESQSALSDAAAPRPAPETPAGPADAEAQPSAPAAVPFEQAPGVLGVSIRTLRQASIKSYPTESVGVIALGLEDLRLRPINKGAHLEVNLAERLVYEGSGDAVPKQARRLLDGIGRLLAEDTDTRVRILVHTDDEGDAGFNLRLSQRRADALKEYLLGRGVAAERIEAVGRGEDAPLANPASKRRPSRSERAKNRRVELIVEPLAVPDADVDGGTTLTLTGGVQNG